MEGIADLIAYIVNYFVSIVYNIMFYFESYLQYDFNIYLFSDTGWFSPSIPLTHLFPLIMGITIFVFVLRLLWKATKKFITMIFGVFRV